MIEARRWPSGLMAAFAVVLACVGVVPVEAAGQFDVRVGIEGVYRTGAWTPLVVSSRERPAAALPNAVWVEDPDGQPVRMPAVPDDAGDGCRRFRVRFGRPNASLMLEQSEGQLGGGLPITLPAPIDSRERMLLVLGDLPAADRAARLLAGEEGGRTRIVSASPLAVAGKAAGISALDFDSVDGIIVCGGSLRLKDGDRQQQALLAATIEAIDGWVRSGGRLVFVAGASAADLDAAGSPALRWLPGPPGRPGKVARLVPLRRSAALETYGRAGRPLEKAALAGLEVPLLADAAELDGLIEAFDGRVATDLPLVVRSAHGFGTVTWIGIDLDRDGFRNWQGTDTLLVELLDARVSGRAARAGGGRSDAVDLAAQLRMALDHFPGVAAVPFEIIAGLGLLYVCCLYPLDWFVVTRLAGRPWLSWLTLPLLVAVFTGLSLTTALAWKGDGWRSSRADLVDVDSVTGLSRGFSYTGIWSPQNARIDLAAAVPRDRAEVALSWFAPAGRGIGGTDAAVSHSSLAACEYRSVGSLAGLEQVPIAASSSRLFEARWTAPPGKTGIRASEPVVSTLVLEGQGTLRGGIESRLGFSLEDCRLLHAGWLYDVGRLDPGGHFEPAAGRGPRSLAGAITRRSASRERDVSTGWDSGSTDVDRILEVAGFHAAVGGSGYTRLEAGRLARLDLSPLLELGRAILVGRGPPATLWKEIPSRLDPDSTPPRSALWRIVLPLQRSAP